VEGKINNDGQRHAVLLFNAGALNVSKKCGADYVRACQFRGLKANLTAFSVGIHR
jgi:hypothetical protein